MNTTNVNDIIVYNTTKGYDYLSIPNEYYCIYTKLLQSLSNLGIDMIKDCKNSCKGNRTNIINCWNMFQTACVAYKLGEVKKADLIIKYINAQMKFNCPNIIRKYSKIIYFGDSYGEPSIEYILNGDKVDFFEYPKFTSPFYKNTQYIAIPEGIIIDYVENGSVGEWLYNRNTNDDEYIKNKIFINGEPYYLWYVTYVKPLDSEVIINLVEGMWQTDSIIYYNQTDNKPTINEVLLGNKFDISTGNKLMTSIYKKGHFIAIPDGHIIESIENASFRGDWLYNSTLGIDLYTKERININDKSYILWYCEFSLPFNASIEIKLDL